MVTDKGYHSREVVRDLREAGIRTYISESERGRQRWSGQRAEQAAVYGNRRRVRSERGKSLQRQRGEMLERVNAHLYETGGMRRTHLRGHPNILKRLLIHVCGLNLGILLRAECGIGTPRGLQNGTPPRLREAQNALFWLAYLILDVEVTTTSSAPDRSSLRSRGNVFTSSLCAPSLHCRPTTPVTSTPGCQRTASR